MKRAAKWGSNLAARAYGRRQGQFDNDPPSHIERLPNRLSDSLSHVLQKNQQLIGDKSTPEN
jgi:hypothetical protein